MAIGYLLRDLQAGEPIGMHHSRPMNSVGPRCHELRVSDGSVAWRLIYRIDDDAVVVLHQFMKKTRKTPRSIIKQCRQRLKTYDER